MKAIKAVYNFLVGDMIILVGTIVAVIILLLMGTMPVMHAYMGAVLIVLTLVILGITLNHELSGKR